MKTLVTLCLAIALAACASFDGRGLVPGQSTAADVESVMGAPAETRKMANGETWLYYPRQPYGRVTFVARLGPGGRLLALEQRLTDEKVEKIIPNTTRAEQVRDLFGPPWSTMHIARMERDIWTWHMRRFGDPGFYFLLVDGRGRHHAQHIPSFRDKLRVFVDEDGILRADQWFTLWGRPVVELRYRMLPRTGPA